LLYFAAVRPFGSAAYQRSGSNAGRWVACRRSPDFRSMAVAL
jgi:hypothetical protein